MIFFLLFTRSIVINVIKKKVITIRRLCVRKLPPVLAIQFKRFEYDYERVCAIKFNDYFEFPRWLDMEPYTVAGLAKIEGEVIDVEENIEAAEDLEQISKFLDSAGNKLDYRRYGEVLFDILIAGLLVLCGSIYEKPHSDYYYGTIER